MPPSCAFTLKYNSKANLDVLKVLEGGIMAQIKSGQMQVLIGAKSNAIFEEVSKQVHITDGSEEDKPAEKPKNKVSAVIETISCAESWLPCLAFSPLQPSWLPKGFASFSFDFSSLVVKSGRTEPPAAGGPSCRRVTARGSFCGLPSLFSAALRPEHRLFARNRWESRRSLGRNIIIDVYAL